MKKTSLILTLIALSGCGTTELRQTTDLLRTVNANLNPSTIGSKKPLPASFKKQNISTVFALPKGNTKLNSSIHSATPFIESMLSEAACLPGPSSNRRMKKYSTPDSYLNRFAAPVLPLLQYHDRSTCLRVTRVHSWQSPARNALKFRAAFESPSSGKSTQKSFTIIRQSNNRWLARF